MTGPASFANGNPTPRVSTCRQCRRPFAASPRGPLPRRCSRCRRPRELVHRIGSARHAARSARAPEPIRSALDALYTATAEWAGSATGVPVVWRAAVASAGDPFSAWLATRLRDRGLSQRRLGRLAGVDHSTISRLVAGETVPRLDTAARLTRALAE